MFLRVIRACWLLASVSAIGCGANSPPGGAEASQAAAVEPKEVSAELKPYLEKGFPSPDRTWSSADYGRCAEALRKIKADKSLPLPRMQPGPSGVIFARIVNERNLDVAANPALALKLSLPDAMGILQNTGPILLTYYEPTAPSQEFGKEMLELSIFMFKTYAAALPLLERQIAELGPKERADPVRRGGVAKIRAGLSTSIQGGLTTLSELSQSRREDLEAFASRLPDVYPRLWSWLEPSVRAEFGIEIGKIEKTHDYPAVRQAMTRLREAITKRAGVDKKIDL